MTYIIYEDKSKVLDLGPAEAERRAYADNKTQRDNAQTELNTINKKGQ